MEGSKQSRFHPETISILWRGAVGLFLWILLMAALSLKGHG
jgi:hypothetical protein